MNQDISIWKNIKPFVLGGVSGCVATSCIQPIDTVKVQIQIKGEERGLHHNVDMRVSSVVKQLYELNGIKGFYKGLGSALLRQVLYATTRFGLYRSLTENYKREHGTLSTINKLKSSAFAGFMGASLANPGDLCLVRFQADQTLPVDQRRNYKNVIDALSRIIREEGTHTLWRGCAPTVVRAVFANVGQLTTYDEVKERLQRYSNRKQETLNDRIIASFCAGFVCSFVSLPFDNMKTKIQKMKQGPDGKLPYSGFIDCFVKSIRREGVVGLWVGFPIYVGRIAPHVIISLLVQDALYSVLQKY